MELFDLAAGQHAAFSRTQARDLGVGDGHLARLADKGIIRRAAPGVFVVCGAPPTWRQRLSVGLLSVPDSMAGFRAAGRLRGLPGIVHAPIELVVEYGRFRRTAPRGVTLHERKDLRGVDHDEVDGFACTAIVRTLVDLPAVIPEERAGEALDHATRHDPGLLPKVVERHAQLARRGRNGTVAMRRLLLERTDGLVVDSGFERTTLRLIKRGNFPRPVTQFHVVDGDFQCWIDIAWPELKLAVECDSLAWHQGERAFRWERHRRRRLIALGWTIVEFTFRDVTNEPETVLRELRHLHDRLAPSIRPNSQP